MGDVAQWQTRSCPLVSSVKHDGPEANLLNRGNEGWAISFRHSRSSISDPQPPPPCPAALAHTGVLAELVILLSSPQVAIRLVCPQILDSSTSPPS